MVSLPIPCGTTSVSDSFLRSPGTKGGIRDYDQESCGWIELMKCMRSAGVQIEALIKYVDLFQQGDATLDARKALLMDQRDRLVARMADMQASLDRLNDKIQRYEQGLMSRSACSSDSIRSARCKTVHKRRPAY